MNQSVKKKREYEINLWDLIWSVLMKWRMLLLGALLMAVLFGGLAYYKDTKNAKAAQNEKVTTVEDIQLSDYSYTRANTYLNLLRLHNKQTEYQKNSYLMNLDANEFYLGCLSYSVQAKDEADEGNAKAYIQSAKNAILEEAFLEKIAERIQATPEQAKYVSELISTDGMYQSELFENGLFVNTNQKTSDDSLLTIYIYAEQKENCDAIKELVDAQIAERVKKQKELTAQLQITKVQDSSVLTANHKLMAFQDSVTNEMYENYVALNGVKKDLAPDELNYVSVALKEMDGIKDTVEPEEQEVQNVQVGINKKTTVAGFLFGFLLVGVVLVFGYLLNTKLRVDDPYETIYGVCMLGHIVDESEKKKRLFGFVDCFIQKAKNGPALGEKDSDAMIASAIKVYAQNSGIKEVYLTGLAGSEGIEKTAKGVEKQLEKESIKIIRGSSILHDASALEQAAKTGTVIFVEEAGKSRYKEIEKEIDVCLQYHIDMLGTVIVS